VLANYTTYKAYLQADQERGRRPAGPEARRDEGAGSIMSFHEHHIAQKVDVMVEHFWRHTRHKITGRAKAMVGDRRGRLEAYQYYRAFQRAVRAEGYAIGLLVAFSGEIQDPETELKWSEPKLNGFKESELPEKFEGAGVPHPAGRGQISDGLRPAECFTPCTSTSGWTASRRSRRLSRLNRTTKGKEDTFVLDFVE